MTIKTWSGILECFCLAPETFRGLFLYVRRSPRSLLREFLSGEIDLIQRLLLCQTGMLNVIYVNINYAPSSIKFYLSTKNADFIF
jgi:hypothetical protein